jgi:hypothetical protein
MLLPLQQLLLQRLQADKQIRNTAHCQEQQCCTACLLWDCRLVWLLCR